MTIANRENSLPSRLLTFFEREGNTVSDKPERLANACLSLIRTPFGKNYHITRDHTYVPQKTTSKAKRVATGAFLFTAFLPVTAVMTLAGIISQSFSMSYRESFKELSEDFDGLDGKIEKHFRRKLFAHDIHAGTSSEQLINALCVDRKKIRNKRKAPLPLCHEAKKIRQYKTALKFCLNPNIKKIKRNYISQYEADIRESNNFKRTFTCRFEDTTIKLPQLLLADIKRGGYLVQGELIPKHEDAKVKAADFYKKVLDLCDGDENMALSIVKLTNQRGCLDMYRHFVNRFSNTGLYIRCAEVVMIPEDFVSYNIQKDEAGQLTVKMFLLVDIKEGLRGEKTLAHCKVTTSINLQTEIAEFYFAKV